MENDMNTLGVLLALAVAPDDFQGTVAPILEARCVRCHGEAVQKGGLALHSAAATRSGGDSGEAVVPGKPDESLLIHKITGDEPEMPKDDERLSAEEVAALRRWIESGAHWPEGITLKGAKRADGPWWAVQPLSRPTVPWAQVWNRSPIDAFLLAGMTAKGLSPSPEADRRTLIRRLTFDLHGLPPRPEEIATYLADDTPDAYERLVDRLLASPRYGERWARHWLDAAHYGDTHGYDKDKPRRNAWRYRDYVIKSLNEDKPYERFVREQVAGDVLWPGAPEARIATGFLAAGPWDFVGHVELREGTVDKEKTRLIDRDDMLTNVMSTFASLTIHCARCHDHKFDPIPQRDYYRLQAVFAGLDRGDRTIGEPRSEEKVYAVLPIAPRPIRLLKRGDVEQPGEPIGPGAPSCVPGLKCEFPDASDEGARRAALAEWITHRDNTLTWRSIVNRVWHHHFGRGIVETPNDFGRNGGLPSHPSLLDWLAVEFRDGGGSFKTLHKLIVTSAAYRQSSAEDSAKTAIDGDARMLWRQSRKRIEAESVRDAVLSVAGDLDLAMGGPGFEPFAFRDDHSPIYDHDAIDRINAPECMRRTIYRFTVRSVPNPFVECLDGADPNVLTPVRNTTITALQALTLLNDPFMIRQSEVFAARLERTGRDRAGQIDEAFALAFGRPPREAERAALVAYAERHGMAKACRVVFNANEFVFVD